MPSREIREGDTVLVLVNGEWKRAVVQVVYRDKHGPIAVVCNGKRYAVAEFKKR